MKVIGVTTGRFMKDFFMDKEKIRNLKFLVDNYNALNDWKKKELEELCKN
jgi:hypothetical protein